MRALLALAALACLPALWGRFLLDDIATVLNHPQLGFADVLHRLHPTGRPLYWLSLAIDHAVWDLAPFGFHLSNLLLHLVNVVLLERLARRLGPPGSPLPRAAAILFALHPLAGSAACYVSERSQLLVALSTLLFLERLCAGQTAWAWAAWILGLASKESAVMAPFLALLLPSLRRRALPFCLGAAAFGAIGLWLHLGAPMNPERPGRLAYALTGLRALWVYLGRWVLPLQLPLDADLPASENGLGAAGLLLLLPLAWRLPWMAAALLALLPESCLVPLQDPLAMHRMYLPSAFLALAAAPVLARRTWLKAAWVPVAVLLSVQAAQAWASPVLLLKHDLRMSPAKLRVHSNLAQGYMALARESGNPAHYAGAERVIRRSLRIRKRPEQWRDLAYAAYERGDDATALRELARALAIQPDRPDCLVLLGYALIRSGRAREGEAALERARVLYCPAP